MFAANWVARFFKGKEAIAAYVPDFTKAFDHFCLHAGARGDCGGKMLTQLIVSWPLYVAPNSSMRPGQLYNSTPPTRTILCRWPGRG